MFEVRPCADQDEYGRAIGAIGQYFNPPPDETFFERWVRTLPHERMHAAFEDGQIVGGAGAFPFELSVPGGSLPCAGVTGVGVLPTHRRRGILGKMMRAQLESVREGGEPIAALWASEETIYGRFGYGLASQDVMIHASRGNAALQPGLPENTGAMRLVAHDEALAVFPRIYDRVRRRQPGFVSRSKDWWEIRKLDDRPEKRRGSGELNRALLEIDGKPAGYALYRIKVEWEAATNKSQVQVIEAVGDSAAAVRELWRFLLAIDWVGEIECDTLPA